VAPARGNAVARRSCNNASVYRHDYILKLIERFGAALISLRDKILRRSRDEVGIRAEIHEIAQHAGLDIAVARSLEPASLLMWLAPTGQPDPAKLWLMAELLYLEGLDGKGSGSSQWRGDLERALAILATLPFGWQPADAFTPAGDRAEEIRGLLRVSAT
jgi:hypothetical protein